MTKCQYKNIINNIHENMAPPEFSYTTTAKFKYYNTSKAKENQVMWRRDGPEIRALAALPENIGSSPSNHMIANRNL